MRTQGRRRLLLWCAFALLAAACVVLTVARIRTSGGFLDDGYIFLRYARNLATGHGLAWNPGEAPVEGFTSLLWVLLLALPFKLGLDPVAFAQGLAIAATVGALVMTLSLARAVLARDDGMALLPVALTALAPATLYWASSGLETSLWVFAVVALARAYLAFIDGLAPWLLGLALFAATLVRPEGWVLVATVGLAELIRRRLWRRSTLAWAGVVLGLTVPLAAWRAVYFHSLLPNTYYAKTGGGLRQLLGGLRYLGESWECWLPGIVAGVFLLSSERLRRRSGWVLLFLATVAAAVAIEGGDQFALGRFLLPALPLSGVLLAALLSRSGPIPRAPLRQLLAGLLVAAALLHWGLDRKFDYTYPRAVAGIGHLRGPWSLHVLPPPDSDREEFLQDLEAGFVTMGKTLRRLPFPARSIAVVPIGAIGYYSGLKVIDMVGLTDPVIAREPADPAYTKTWRPGHDKGDGRYVLARRPDLIQLQDALSSRPMPEPHPVMMQYKSVVEIWSSPQFWRDYEFVSIQTEGGWYYNLYRRRR